MGLLSGLFGDDTGAYGTAVTPTQPTAQTPGLMGGATMTLQDRLSSPLSQVGLALMQNRAIGPAIAQGLASSAKLGQEKQQRNLTLEMIQKDAPDLAGYIQAGVPVTDVFKAWADRKTAERKAALGGDLTSDQRNYQFALDNPGFAKFLKGSRADETPTSIREITERQRLAGDYGVDPSTPEGRAFVLTGKLPSAERTSTADDRKAIREADDTAREGDQTFGLLDQALKMSPDAYDGATAGVRTWMGNNLYDGAVPDWIADPKTAAATKEYDNIVTTQALNSLKSTFGGAPTEGERQILLDVQGMSSQPKEVREAIIKRAKEAVQRRTDFNRERASELRGGSYYDARPSQAGARPGVSGGQDYRGRYGLE